MWGPLKLEYSFDTSGPNFRKLLAGSNAQIDKQVTQLNKLNHRSQDILGIMQLLIVEGGFGVSTFSDIYH